MAPLNRTVSSIGIANPRLKWRILASYTRRCPGSTTSLRCYPFTPTGPRLICTMGPRLPQPKKTPSHSPHRSPPFECDAMNIVKGTYGCLQLWSIGIHRPRCHIIPCTWSYGLPHHWLTGSFTSEPQPLSAGPQLLKLVKSITRSAVAPYSGDHTNLQCEMHQ